MPKVKNDEFRKKSLEDIEEYADEHPAEGGRLAKLCGDSAAHCVKRYFEYQVDRVTGGANSKKPQPET